MKVNPLIVFRREDEWSMLFNPDTSDTYALDATSAFIWERLEEGKGFDEILAEMREVTNLPDSARQDLAAFLATLQTKGYIMAGPISKL